ncbi:MAG TPA: hypothetical protein VGX27_02805 [Candidatus Dormibacteraeota bacterium]|nr:hypothetical protein [Candidatus Dormibacteraeota bacterium]
MRNPTPAPVRSPVLRWLPYLFAAGAIFWLVQLTQSAALAAAPVGRAQLEHTLIAAGMTQNTAALLVVYFAAIFVFEATAAGLHGAAYYGLKAMRWWGWVVAVIVAGAWSLLLVGIPVLAFLLQRQTRQAYGVL